MAGQRKMLGPGDAAPAFTLSDTTGNVRSLSGLLDERPVLLAFFKISCPVCQMALPFLERVRENESVHIIGVSQDDEKKTSQFMRAFGIKFDMLLDSDDAGYPASNGFGISTVPSIFQIEKDGRVSHAWEGWVKGEMQALGRRVGKEIIRPTDQVPPLRPG